MDNVRSGDSECSYCGSSKPGYHATIRNAEVFLCRKDFDRMSSFLDKIIQVKPEEPVFARPNGVQS